MFVFNDKLQFEVTHMVHSFVGGWGTSIHQSIFRTSIIRALSVVNNYDFTTTNRIVPKQEMKQKYKLPSLSINKMLI